MRLLTIRVRLDRRLRRASWPLGVLEAISPQDPDKQKRGRFEGSDSPKLDALKVGPAYPSWEGLSALELLRLLATLAPSTEIAWDERASVTILASTGGASPCFPVLEPLICWQTHEGVAQADEKLTRITFVPLLRRRGTMRTPFCHRLQSWARTC